MGSEHYCLRWNNHQSNLLGVFSQLLRDESLVDVTLACSEGHSIRAHKVVLSACSSYFQTLFVDHPSRHPIVILKDVRFSELRTLIEFMYKGEVNVEYCQLSALLKTAESLKVKGLAEMTNLGPKDTADHLVHHQRLPEQTEPTELTSKRQRQFDDDERTRSPSGERTPTPPPPQMHQPLHLQKINSARVERRSSSPPPPPPEAAGSPGMEADDGMDVGGGGGTGVGGGLLHSNGSAVTSSAAATAALCGGGRLPSPVNCDPVPGPSSMPPVQQVPLSLKKEVDWSSNADDKSTGESSSDFPRHPHESEPQQEDPSACAGQSSPRLYHCMYCGTSFPHQSKLTRHILSHSLETLKYREQHHLQQQQHLPDPLFDSHFSGRIPAVPHEPPDPTDQPPTAATASAVPMEFELADASGVVLCKFCGKSFPDVSSLISHLPVHTGDRPFKCEFCGKAFKLRHHMKDHCRVHTGERPFRCALCGKTFSRSTILKAHEKTHYPKYVRKFLSPSPLDTEEESPH